MRPCLQKEKKKEHEEKENSFTSVYINYKHMAHYPVSLDTGDLDLLVFKTFNSLILIQMKCKYLVLQVIISRENVLLVMKETSKDPFKSNSINKISKGEIHPQSTLKITQR